MKILRSYSMFPKLHSRKKGVIENHEVNVAKQNV